MSWDDMVSAAQAGNVQEAVSQGKALIDSGSDLIAVLQYLSNNGIEGELYLSITNGLAEYASPDGSLDIVCDEDPGDDAQPCRSDEQIGSGLLPEWVFHPVGILTIILLCLLAVWIIRGTPGL